MNFVNLAAVAALVLMQSTTTLQEVTTRGITMKVYGLEFGVTYTPDGKFVGGPVGQQVQGVWRIDGETLCTSTGAGPEVCAIYPAGKKSGDVFDVPGAMGPAMGVVRVRIN